MLELGPNGGRKVAEALPTTAACAKALCQNEHVHPGGTKEHMAGPRGRRDGGLHWLWELIELTLEGLQGHGEVRLPVPEQ